MIWHKSFILMKITYWLLVSFYSLFLTGIRAIHKKKLTQIKLVNSCIFFDNSSKLWANSPIYVRRLIQWNLWWWLFTCPKVHLSEESHFRWSNCLKVHLSEGFVIRNNTLVNNLFLWLKHINFTPNRLPDPPLTHAMGREFLKFSHRFASWQTLCYNKFEFFSLKGWKKLDD